jgi:DNA mismatch endonuclease (patch repair protein)
VPTREIAEPEGHFGQPIEKLGALELLRQATVGRGFLQFARLWPEVMVLELEAPFVEPARLVTHRLEIDGALFADGQQALHSADKPPKTGYTPPVDDVFTKKKRSQVMAAIRSRGNKATELKLASILRAAGITGWRRHRPLPGHPDFIFRHARLAVFVDGCFWHGCRWHCRMPRDNRRYWQTKITRNALRDQATSKLLRRAGWRVLRVWEHSLRSPQAVLAKITSELSAAPEVCKSTPGLHERAT